MDERSDETAPARSTHLDEQGRLRMVDVGAKPQMRRRAVAAGDFRAPSEALDALVAGHLPKGEALAAARIAGIQAAKRCDELIPLCHTLPLDAVTVDFERAAPGTLRIIATASTTSRTGASPLGRSAVSAAALTLWDMTKGISTDLAIEGIRLLEKTKTPIDGPFAGPG